MAGTCRRLWSQQIRSLELGEKDGGGAPAHLGQSSSEEQGREGEGGGGREEEREKRRSSLFEEGARSRKPFPPPWVVC